MDFKSLIGKLDSIQAPIKTPSAPTLPQAVQLNEDAQLRVLAGRTTYVSEAKKKADDEKKKTDKKVEEAATVKYDADGKRTGVVNKDTRKYSDEPHSEPASKAKSQSAADKEKDRAADKDHAKDSKAYEKAHGKGSVTRVKDGKKVESVEPEFKSRFMKMVEAKKEEADKKKKMAKKEKMAEGGLPMTTVNGKKVPAFAADGKGKNDLGKGKNTETDDSDGSDEKDSKGLSAKQKKLPPGLQKAIAAKSESKIMPKGKKRPVKESVETTMSFKEMVQLVQESGGQQQIDPIDRALFTWAERVAKNKLGEGMKADLYAGLVYERNGGEFEMYDVLSETQK